MSDLSYDSDGPVKFDVADLWARLMRVDESGGLDWSEGMGQGIIEGKMWTKVRWFRWWWWVNPICSWGGGWVPTLFSKA